METLRGLYYFVCRTYLFHGAESVLGS